MAHLMVVSRKDGLACTSQYLYGVLRIYGIRNQEMEKVIKYFEVRGPR